MDKINIGEGDRVKFTNALVAFMVANKPGYFNQDVNAAFQLAMLAKLETAFDGMIEKSKEDKEAVKQLKHAKTQAVLAFLKFTNNTAHLSNKLKEFAAKKDHVLFGQLAASTPEAQGASILDSITF